MKKKLFTYFLALSLCGFTYSQESDVLLNKLVEKNVLTKEEANEIKRESKAETQSNNSGQTQETLKSLFKTPLATIGGYGQLLYDYNNASSTKNDFSARAAYISIDGVVNKKFRYLVFLEFTNPKLVEYWTEWTLDPKFNLRLGQYKAGISMEHVLSGAVIETIDYSRVVRNTLGYGAYGDVMSLQNNKGNMGRDLGMQASGQLINKGDHCLLQYTVGLFQGSGMNSRDMDSNKDFAASLYVQPIKGLRVGGAAYLGSVSYYSDHYIYNPNNSGGLLPPPNNWNKVSILDTHVRNRWILSGEYASNKILFRSEYIHANDAGTTKKGLYGLGLYQMDPNWSLMCKYDYYNNGEYRNDSYAYEHTNNTEVKDYTLGVRYQFFGQCTAMANYIYTDVSNGWKNMSGETNHHRVAAQLQVVF